MQSPSSPLVLTRTHRLLAGLAVSGVVGTLIYATEHTGLEVARREEVGLLAHSATTQGVVLAHQALAHNGGLVTVRFKAGVPPKTYTVDVGERSDRDDCHTHAAVGQAIKVVYDTQNPAVAYAGDCDTRANRLASANGWWLPILLCGLAVYVMGSPFFQRRRNRA